MECYDNGSNMAEKYKRVQSQILQAIGLANYVPCTAHSLNLVCVNASILLPEADTLGSQIAITNISLIYNRSEKHMLLFH